MTEREELARIIDPGAWEKTYDCWRFADWHECQQRALAKADKWLSRPSPVDGLKASLDEATSATMMAEMRADKLASEVERLKGVTSVSLLSRLSAAAERERELVEALEASATAHEKLLREWMYAPFPKEAQIMGQMSPPSGPFAEAAEAIRAARALQAKEPT
jgi:hypothetical protein